MPKKESKRNKLLELIRTEPMTSKELAKKLNISMEFTWVYLSQFQKDGKIIKCGKKGKFNLYSAVELNPIELLKQLYNIMNNKMTPKPKEELTAEEMEYIIKIEKVLKVE